MQKVHLLSQRVRQKTTDILARLFHRLLILAVFDLLRALDQRLSHAIYAFHRIHLWIFRDPLYGR